MGNKIIAESWWHRSRCRWTGTLLPWLLLILSPTTIATTITIIVVNCRQLSFTMWVLKHFRIETCFQIIYSLTVNLLTTKKSQRYCNIETSDTTNYIVKKEYIVLSISNKFVPFPFHWRYVHVRWVSMYVFQCSENDRFGIFFIVYYWSDGIHTSLIGFRTIGELLLHLYFCLLFRSNFSCYLFNLMEERKSIAFIGKRFCHAYIDFIAKSEQILRFFCLCLCLSFFLIRFLLF